jgi:hypothetical protein
MKSMKQMALEFSHAFGRPVNNSVVSLTVSERELLGKLIFEEVVEYVTRGLGLKLTIDDGVDKVDLERFGELGLELNEGQPYDPIESADGLGDINVLVHFNSLWHGFNLDAITHEIFLSNMSKLDEFGDPIINECEWDTDGEGCHHESAEQCTLTDPTKPVGKILKGPNYFPPDIARVIGINQGEVK